MDRAALENSFCKIVKLKTGEFILCAMDRDVKSLASETHIGLIEPVQVVGQQEKRQGNMIVGETYLLRPWIGLSDTEEFTVSTDIILTIGDQKNEVREQYINYIEHTHETKQRQADRRAIHSLLEELSPSGNVYIINEDEIDHER